MSERQRVDLISLPPGGDEPGLAHAASMAELGVLAASLLHELRQPLFAIKAHAQLARAESGARPERLERILEQVGHIEELIRYYGGFACADEPESLYDLNEAVRAAMDLVAHRKRRAPIELVAELAPGALLVRGREVAARQVALNLLQNAYDAVEDGESRRVRVATSAEEGALRLVVEDSGPGVPDELRIRMFEPFVTTKPPGRGTGLGLYIARRLVKEAGGRLELAEGGAGTRFDVLLPRAS